MYVMLVCWCLIRVSYIVIILKFIPSIQMIFWAYPMTWALSSHCFSDLFPKVRLDTRTGKINSTNLYLTHRIQKTITGSDEITSLLQWFSFILTHIQFLTAVSVLFPLFIHSYFRFVKNTEMFPVYFDQPVFLHLSKLI